MKYTASCALPRHPRIVSYFGVRQEIRSVFGHQNANQIHRTLHLQIAEIESSR